jgi:putative transposase
VQTSRVGRGADGEGPGGRFRSLTWNQRHLMTVLREYEDFCNTNRPHRALDRAAVRSLPDGVTGLDHFRVRRRTDT